jgi:protein-disulfide isomerase
MRYLAVSCSGDRRARVMGNVVATLKRGLDWTATLATIAAAALLGWTLVGARLASAGVNINTQPVPTQAISLEQTELRGSPAARVVLIEYADFACPYCAKFARGTLPELEKEYIGSGKVLLAFKNVPLPIHPLAEGAAEAAECAGRQGKFWAMHDQLYLEQGALGQSALLSDARALHLDIEQFERCSQNQVGDLVKSQVAEARALGVTGTPTFFVGTRRPDGQVHVVQRVTGAQSPGMFKVLLDKALATSGV